MRFTLNIDFQGLCAFVPTKANRISVLMVATSPMHKHHPRMWVQNECIALRDVARFNTLEPSSQGFLTSSLPLDGCVATIGQPADTPSHCERGIIQQEYPDERDKDDCFWVPSYADFTSNYAVTSAALKRVPNRYVVARIDVDAGNFIALNHLTTRGRFSRFIYKNPKGTPQAKAFADCVRLVVDVKRPPFKIRIRRHRGRKLETYNLNIGSGANATAWMAFTNLPSRPAPDTNPMAHMPLFRRLLNAPWPPLSALPKIDPNKPTFGDTRTWYLNVHTGSCPPGTFAPPNSMAVALRGRGAKS